MSNRKSRVGSKYYIVAAGVPTLALTLLYGNNYPGAKIINQEYEKGRTDQQVTLEMYNAWGQRILTFSVLRS